MKALLPVVLIFAVISCRPDQEETDYSQLDEVLRADLPQDGFERPSNDINDPSFDTIYNGENTGEGESSAESEALENAYESAKVQCQQASTYNTRTTEIYFPATDNCQFNEDADSDDEEAINQFENGPRKNGKVRAYLRQDINLDLPAGSILCDMTFSFPEQEMEYDDEIFLLLNDFVMMMSTDYSRNSTKRNYRRNGLRVNSQGLVHFKWLGGDYDLYNLDYGQNEAPRFCQGISRQDPVFNQRCEVPRTQRKGKIVIDIPQADIIRMGSLNFEQENSSQLKFSFVSTGDNDDFDCEHSAYSFRVSAKYITK